MAAGLVGLLDDVAALAKLAAASIDDVGVAAGKASMKAAGVIIDDTAVTPTYVQELAAERELPIIKRIAIGSVRNKLLIILPAALLLSALAPKLVEVILILGGSYLSYEGAHKILHAIQGGHDDAPSVVKGAEAEEETIKGAIRTDLILSAEVMVIALKEVLKEPIVERAVVLVVVALLITVLVYGVVGLIVKLDDIGLAMTRRESSAAVRIGTALVKGTPKLLNVLTIVGTAAMVWVGGHILVSSLHELGWHAPHDVIHHLVELMPDLGVISWLTDTFASAVVGLIVGFAVVGVVMLVQRLRSGHAPSHS